MSEFLNSIKIETPVICGPMYPCSNPELVAAVSESGGIGIVQPISLTFVHGYDFREGLRYIKSLTSKPIGFNALIEKSSSKYHEKMIQWVDIALDEGVRFFITSLGNPSWVVKKVKAKGGFVYHDVTERKWAEKGISAGVDGLIAVNKRSGGHAGHKTKEELFKELSKYNIPLICAGGIGGPKEFQEALALGYQGCQLGTRFIASVECKASNSYKQAILDAGQEDVVLSEKITGVPVSVINTPYIQKMGLKANFFMRWMLQGAKTKHWVRSFYTLKSIFQLKKSMSDEETKKEFWQAGKSVEEITEIQTVHDIMESFKKNIS